MESRSKNPVFECGQDQGPAYGEGEGKQSPYMPGLKWFRIDGVDVSEEEFNRRITEEGRAKARR